MKLKILAAAAVATFCCCGMFAADAGADLYKTKCQGCHGADGHASAIGKKLGAKDLQDPDVKKMTEQDFIDITTNGKNKMPLYKGKLTDAQIKDLAKYMKDMSK
jgi:mono/diheme cytochrome c family protein